MNGSSKTWVFYGLVWAWIGVHSATAIFASWTLWHSRRLLRAALQARRTGSALVYPLGFRQAQLARLVSALAWVLAGVAILAPDFDARVTMGLAVLGSSATVVNSLGDWRRFQRLRQLGPVQTNNDSTIRSPGSNSP